MVRLLRDRMDEIKVVNPYTESIIKFLGESEYFKRDFDKYNGILKTITVLNGYNRESFDIDGEKTLFTTLADIQIFISLLTVYHESISVNISPKAALVLDEIRANIDDWTLDPKGVSEIGSFTTNDYFRLSKLNLQLRSIQSYFGELNNAGFIKVIGNQGKSNIYQMSGKVTKDLEENLLVLSEGQKQLISWEYDSIVLQFIEEDCKQDNLTIFLNDETVDIPPWDHHDSKRT
jgi:hypothetical protein